LQRSRICFFAFQTRSLDGFLKPNAADK